MPNESAIGQRGKAVRKTLDEKTKKSRDLAAQSSELLNMGSAASLEMPHPILMDRAEGSRIWDADGNEYIDTMLGFGLHILGHGHPAIKEALHERIEKGWHFGIHNPKQVPLAELLTEAANCAERVIFCNTGTEATMYAMRVARAYTGKWKVAMFDGCYHGAHDYGMVLADPASPRAAPDKRPMGAGVPPSTLENQVLLPYREEAAFDYIREHKDELALVIIEPVQSSNPHLNDETKSFLHDLHAVCQANDVLFALDEVITGFRISWGGAQEYYDLKPDLATYGKALGGGMPIGAVAGRADVMALFNSMAAGDPKGIFSGGTYSGNPMSMTAGIALVSALKDNQEIYSYINSEGDRLRERVNGFARSENMAIQMLNGGSMFQLYFQTKPIRSSRDITGENAAAEREFYLHLLNNGVLVPGTRRAFLSAAHTTDDVDQIAVAIENSLTACREDGLL